MRPPRPYRQRLEEIQKRREGIIERASLNKLAEQQQSNNNNNDSDADVIDLTAFEEDMGRGGFDGKVKGIPNKSPLDGEGKKDTVAASREAAESPRGMHIHKTVRDHHDGRAAATPSKMDIAREQDFMRDDNDDHHHHSSPYYYEGYEHRQAMTQRRRFFPDDYHEHGMARPKHGSEIVLLESMDSETSSAYLQGSLKPSVPQKLPSNSNTVFRPSGPLSPPITSNSFSGNPELTGGRKVNQPVVRFDGLEHVGRGKERNKEDSLTVLSGDPEKPVLLLDDMDEMKKPHEDEGATVLSGAPEKPVDLTNNADQIRQVGSAEKPLMLLDDSKGIRRTPSQSLSTAAIHTTSPKNRKNVKSPKIKQESEPFRRMKSAEESPEFLEMSIEKSNQVLANTPLSRSPQMVGKPSGSPIKGTPLKHSSRVGSSEKPMVLVQDMERVHRKVSLEYPWSPKGPTTRTQLEDPKLVDSDTQDDSSTVQSGTEDKPVVLFEGIENVDEGQYELHDHDSTYASRGGRMNERNDQEGSGIEGSQASGQAIYRRALRRHGGRRKLQRQPVFIPRLNTVEEPISPDRETQSPDGFDDDMVSQEDIMIDAEEETNSIIEEFTEDAQDGKNEVELARTSNKTPPSATGVGHAKECDSPVVVLDRLGLSPVSSAKSNDDISTQPLSSPTPSVDKLERSRQERVPNPTSPIVMGNAIALRSDSPEKLELPSREIVVTHPVAEDGAPSDKSGGHTLPLLAEGRVQPDLDKDTNEEKKPQLMASFVDLHEANRSNETDKSEYAENKGVGTNNTCFVGGCIAPMDPPGDSIRKDGVEVKDNGIVGTLLKEMKGAKEKCKDNTFDIKNFLAPEKTAERLERLRQRLAVSTSCQHPSTPADERSSTVYEEVNSSPRGRQNQDVAVLYPKEMHDSRHAYVPTEAINGETLSGVDRPTSLLRESRYGSHSSPIKVPPPQGDHDSRDSSTHGEAVSGASSENPHIPVSTPRTNRALQSNSMPTMTVFDVPYSIPSDEMESSAVRVDSVSRPYPSFNVQGNPPMQVSSLEFSDPEGVSKIVETARNSLGQRNDSFDAMTSLTLISQPVVKSKQVIRLDYEDFKKVVTGRSVSEDDPVDKSIIQLLDKDDEAEEIPKKPKKDLNISDYETPSSGVSSGDDSPESSSSSSEDGMVREGVAESSDSFDAKISVDYSQHSESDLDTNYDMYDTCAVPFLTKFFVKSCDWLDKDHKSPSLLRKTKKRAEEIKNNEKRCGKAGEAAEAAFGHLEDGSRKHHLPRKVTKKESVKKLSPYARPRGNQQKLEQLSVQHGDQSEPNSSSDSSLAHSTTFQKKLQGRLESIRTQTPPLEGKQSEALQFVDNKETRNVSLSLQEKLQERLKNTVPMKHYPTHMPDQDGNKSGSDAENIIVSTGTDLSKGATSKEPDTFDQFMGRRARLLNMAGGPEGINSRPKKAEIVFEKINKASPRPSPTSIVQETTTRSPNSTSDNQKTGKVAKKTSRSPSKSTSAQSRNNVGWETHMISETTSWSPARSHVSDFVIGGNRSKNPISPENIAKQLSWSPTRAGRYLGKTIHPEPEDSAPLKSTPAHNNLAVNTNATFSSTPVNSKGGRSPRRKSKSPRKTGRSPRRISPARSSLSKKSSSGSKSSSHASLPDDIEENLSDTIATLDEEERVQALELVEKLRRRAATLKRRRYMRQRRMKQLEEMSNHTPDDALPSSRDPPAAAAAANDDDDDENLIHKSPRMSGPPQPEVQV